ncbi:MAG: hypothetical protein AAGD05_06765 [Bacteroidota bacterium]
MPRLINGTKEGGIRLDPLVWPTQNWGFVGEASFLWMESAGFVKEPLN